MRRLISVKPSAWWAGGWLEPLDIAEPWGGWVGGFEVGDADGEGVGGVVGRGFLEFEEGADHEGDLGFVCGSAADDGLFDATWGVFGDWEAGFGWGDNGGGAGCAEGDGGAEVLDEDGAFDGAAVRVVVSDDGADGGGDGGEALGLEEGGFVADDAPCDGAVGATGAFEDGPAGVAEGWVDGEDPRGGGWWPRGGAVSGGGICRRGRGRDWRGGGIGRPSCRRGAWCRGSRSFRDGGGGPSD
jgi:hypothetical protein